MRSVIGVVVRSIPAAAEISPPPSKSTAISSTVIIIERVIPIILVPSKAAKSSPLLLRCAAADSSLLDATHRIDKGYLNLPPVDFPAVQVLPRVFRVFQLPKLHATKLPPVAEGDVFDPAMFVLLVELVRVENLPHVVSRQSRGDVRNVQNVRRVSAFTSYSRLRLFVKISRNFSTMMIAVVVFRRRRLDDGRPTPRVVQSHLLLYKLSLSMMISKRASQL